MAHEAKPIAADDGVSLTRLPSGGISALCHSAAAAIDEVYGPEESHSRDEPRVRRIKTPHLHEPAYARVACPPKIVEASQDLWGTARFDTGKLNMKSAGFGATVECHQDWAFYPHTNDDLSVGIMPDDCAIESDSMVGIPGSHQGPGIRSSRP
jgi:phytanoyl-CoA hydroxylase